MKLIVSKNRWILISRLACPLLLFLCLFFACASAPNIELPDPMPTYIREYKKLRINGNRNKVDTGINLHKGDVYSVIAAGQINLGGRKIGPYSSHFHQYIGKTYLGFLFGIGGSSIFEATTSGRLYLGILDSYPND